MIQETLTKKNRPAITSDQWHVIRARWSEDSSGAPRFERSIVSEHDDRAAARAAAHAVHQTILADMPDQPRPKRDHVIVRRPAYKSLKTANRRKR